MSSRFRFGFLPVFFIALTVVLVLAVILRIRSYDDAPAAAPAITATGSAESEPSTETVVPPPDTMEESRVQRGFGTQVLSTQMEFNADPGSPAVNPAPVSSRPVPPAPVPPATVTTTGPESATRSGPRSVNVTARPAATPSSATPPPQPSSSTPDPDGGSSSKPPADPPPDENDPTSDTAAPQLISVDFTPPEVKDGEQTMLLVQATDALSGVRSVSGTLAAPTGAVQGFACQKEGDTGRFVSRISVPRDAAEGVWQINHLSILDNANNVATFTPRGTLPPTASFRVVSTRPDDTGPSLKALWIDKRSMRGGEKNTLFVEADDDKSGVNLVTGIIQSPSRLARVGFVCRTNGPATWACEITAPACSDCGEWRLEQMQLQDKANNMTTVRPDNPLVGAIRVDVSSAACDATPPELVSLALDQKSISNAQPGTIAVTAMLSDDACGVLSVSGHATGPSPTGAPLHFFLSVTGEADRWAGKINIPQLLAKGTWRIQRIQVLDKGQNLKTYSASDPVLAGGVFEVR